MTKGFFFRKNEEVMVVPDFANPKAGTNPFLNPRLSGLSDYPPDYS